MGSTSKADIRYARNPRVERALVIAAAALRAAESALRLATARALGVSTPAQRKRRAA
jgi:hypothetical protein